MERKLSTSIVAGLILTCAFAASTLAPSPSLAQQSIGNDNTKKVSNAASASKLREFTSKYLTATPVVLDKAEIVVSAKSIDYLEKSVASKSSTNFWVFFADKGSSAAAMLAGDPQDFAVLSKSLKRRAKVGLNKIVFADLPVEQDYIATIEELGVASVRNSRWLNATVFSANASPGSNTGITQLLERIASLPFVIEIKPALTFARKQDAQKLDQTGQDFQGPTGSSLYRSAGQINYGSSVAQITQIKSDVGHQRGFKGQGVTIAMLDTGYRKSHQAFAIAFIEGRVLAEHDFINNDGNTANEVGDAGSQWSHGTLTWSAAGGQLDGTIYGPAYGANFLLAKTENVTSETIQEEFDWVSAMEWADSLGADVISSSLGYIDWYTFADLDGATAVTTVGANMAAALGIVVSDAMGNSGPAVSTLIAPADAHDILSVGAVDVSGNVASFSSRGPTADGRIKPDVSARGVSTWSASSNSDAAFTSASGTSLSTPLVAGAAAQIISAKPTFPPVLIIRAMKETASQAQAPDNNIGWGIIDVEAALDWGVNFTADGSRTSIIFSNSPATVAFNDVSDITASDWSWNFGDSQSDSGNASPVHNYDTTGLYNVSLTIQTAFGPFSKTTSGMVLIIADTVRLASDSGYAGNSVALPVILTNSQPLQSIEIPVSYADPLIVSLDSATAGARTTTFLAPQQTAVNPLDSTAAYRITSAGAPLDPGTGEVMKLYFTLDPLALGGASALVDSATISGSPLQLTAPLASYPPQFASATISTKFVLRADADNTDAINIADVTYLVAWIFSGGPGPVTVQSGDANADFDIRIDDVLYLIEYIFRGGPAPPSP